MEIQRPTKLFNTKFVYLFAVSVLIHIAFNMITPILPKYVISIAEGELMYDHARAMLVAGQISGILSYTALIARPLSAAAADRLNKKLLIVASVATMGATAMCYCLVRSITVLFIARFIQGLGFSLLGTTINAFALNFVPLESMGKGVAYYSLTYTLAQAVGPMIGINVSDKYGHSAAFFVAACFCAVSIILLLAAKNIKAPRVVIEGQERKKIKLSELFAVQLVPIMLFSFVFSLGSAMTTNFLSIIGDERGIANISLFFTLYAVLLLGVKPLIGSINDRTIFTPYTIIPAFICEAISMVLIAIATNLVTILFAGVFFAVCMGVLQPTIQSECIRRLGPARSGLAIASYYLGADVGNGSGAMIGGQISGKYGFATTLYIVAAAIIIAAIAFYFYRRFSKVYRGIPFGAKKKAE